MFSFRSGALLAALIFPLAGCLEPAEDGTLVNELTAMPGAQLIEEDTAFEDVTTEFYSGERADRRDFYEAGHAFWLPEARQMAFTNGTAAPENFYQGTFYELAEDEYLGMMVRVDFEDGEPVIDVLTGRFLVFVHAYDDVFVVHPYVAPEFLAQARAGTAPKAAPDLGDNPFAGIADAARKREAAPPEATPDAEPSETVKAPIYSLADAQQISAALKAANYISPRTMFLRVQEAGPAR